MDCWKDFLENVVIIRDLKSDVIACCDVDRDDATNVSRVTSALGAVTRKMIGKEWEHFILAQG